MASLPNAPEDGGIQQSGSLPSRSSRAPSMDVDPAASDTKGYALILPKPGPRTPLPPQLALRCSSVSTESRLFRLRNPSTGCYVPKCQLKACHLVSHHQVVYSTFSSQLVQDRTPDGEERRSRSASTSNSSAPKYSLDALPSLPISTPSSPELKELFHRFFSHDYPRLTALLSAPALTAFEKKKAEARRQEALHYAVTEPVCCLNYIASAHLHLLSRQVEHLPSKLSVKLHGQLLQLMRNKLDDFEVSEVDNLLLVIFTIVQFDWALNNHIALEGHRSALKLLIMKRGGIYNLDRALPYILNLDRTLAMYTEKPPLFSETPDRIFLRPPRSPLKYGFGFDPQEDHHEIDKAVLYLCYDVNRALEIVENEEWTFEPGRSDDKINASEIQYLYFLRSHISNSFGNLQAQPFPSKPKSKPILFATFLISYQILNVGYLATVVKFLSCKLKELLEQDNWQKEWAGQEDIFAWMLCALLSTPAPENDRNWAKKAFTSMLETRFQGRAWPQDWIQIQLGSVCNFVWSSFWLDKRLVSALAEINNSEMT